MFGDYITVTTGWDWSKTFYCTEERDKAMLLKNNDKKADEAESAKSSVAEELSNDETIAKNKEERELLKTILNSIMPDAGENVLTMQMYASGLDGIAYQLIHFLNGQGGNGKSLLLMLMKAVLGDYYYQAPSGMTNELQKPNSASPDLFNCMNKRWINFTEVKGTVNVGVIRNLTGGGEFQGRLLNQNPTTFKMIATFSMEFNNAPELDGKPQQSDYRRAVYHSYMTNFVDKNKNLEKIGKTINGRRYLEANLEYVQPQFIVRTRQFWFDWLSEIYRSHAKEATGMSFTIPTSVLNATDSFLNEGRA